MTLRKHLAKQLANEFLDFDVSLYAWAYQQLDCFSKEELQALQFRKLKKILMHAADTVPYWQRIFNKVGFDPRNFTEQDFSGLIRVMTRENIKNLPLEDVLSTAIHQERRIPISTSGSTGEPLSFFQDLYEIPRRSAIAFLAMHYGGFMKKKPVLVLGRSGPHLSLIGKTVSGASLESETFREEKLYPLLGSYRPNVVLGTVSYLLRLAHYLKKDDITVSLRGLISTGEELSKEGREKLEKFFKCPLGSMYATNECAVIGITCSHDKYHCLPLLNYVEIVDDHGVPCQDGEMGKIVVTLFENMVMPFIRYEIGDEGVFEKELCRCGRKSKIMTFTGRAPMYIQLGEKRMNVRFLESLLTDHCRGIKKFQIVQDSPNFITVRYLSATGSLNESKTAAAIGETLRRHAGVAQEVHVSFKKVNELLPNIFGKVPIFVSIVGN